jgi:NAD(P)-dependent dehydrogenase (short-subunit alcohol dehydrogenase family)
MLYDFSKRSNLSGRTILVTGASGHIASSFAFGVAGLGAHLILVDIDEEGLIKLKSSIEEKFGTNVDIFITDLENEDSRAGLISEVNSNYECLDVLIHAAALVPSTDLRGWASEWEFQTLDSWRKGLEINLTSVFDITKGLTPLLFKSQSASIINIGSLYGFLGPDWELYRGTSMGNSASYSASKGGLLQLSRWLATTLAPRVRVNSISPGGIFRDQEKPFVAKFEERTPLKRMGREEDLVGACIFLATDLSLYVTGQNIVVDGGWSTW